MKGSADMVCDDQHQWNPWSQKRSVAEAFLQSRSGVKIPNRHAVPVFFVQRMLGCNIARTECRKMLRSVLTISRYFEDYSCWSDEDIAERLESGNSEDWFSLCNSDLALPALQTKQNLASSCKTDISEVFWPVTVTVTSCINCIVTYRQGSWSCKQICFWSSHEGSVAYHIVALSLPQQIPFAHPNQTVFCLFRHWLDHGCAC